MALSKKLSIEYLEEITIQLQAHGFTVLPLESRDIDIAYDGKPLCRVSSRGGLGYFEENAVGKEAVLEQIRDIVNTTREYMTLMEQAPPLEVEGLGKGYQLLADFNGTVLAGHKTRFGVQFITWDWTHNRTSLWQGHYYGPHGLTGSYEKAKRDFAVRSGLLPANVLFTQEQLTEVFYNFLAYGLQQTEKEQGQFNTLGYISYHGDLTLDELLREAPAEQCQREQGPQMGGLS